MPGQYATGLVVIDFRYPQSFDPPRELKIQKELYQSVMESPEVHSVYFTFVGFLDTA